MSEKSAFSKENLKTISIDNRDWLEQLNVPPALADFIRKNNQAVVAALVAIAVALVGWNFYTNHQEKKRDAAAAALAAAMKETTPEARKPLLDKVTQDFGGSGAADWARIEQGHDAASAGNHADAIAHYKAVLAGLSSDSSVKPLVQYALAAAHEASGATEEARKLYEMLLADASFANLTQLSLARLMEKTGDRDKAVAAYEKFLSAVKDTASNDKTWAEERLAALKKTGSPPAGETPGK